jgi:hypothetical protein
MKTARHLLLTLAFVCAVQTHAGNATRIQLVVDVPSQILTKRVTSRATLMA